MSEDVLTDDQSHYEISLTAGQAFVAFVLLLLSLAASFTFGLMIGKGQGDERLVVRKEPAVKIVELGVADDAFKAPPPPVVAPTTTETPIVTEQTTTQPPPAAPAIPF